MTDIHCLKCRRRTETIDVTRDSRKEIGKCLQCGTKKCRFVRVIKGEGVEERGHFAKYAKLAYAPIGERGTNLDRKLSTDESSVWLEGNDLIIGYRGSTPTNADLISDSRILIGTFLNGPRFKRSLKTTQEAMKRYPSKRVILVGHSLGARLSHDVGMLLGVKSYSFNIGSSPVDIPQNIVDSLRCKFTTDEKHKEACNKIKENNKSYHSYGDPLSLSSITGHAQTEFVKPTQANVHGIENFIPEPESQLNK